MSAALDLLKSLSADGVEFSTDGERIRWRNSNDMMTPEIVAALAAEKAVVIDFLTGKARPAASAAPPVPPADANPPPLPDAGRLAGAEQAPRQTVSSAPVARDLRQDWKPDTVALPGDADTYADALHLHGPMSYGAAMRVLGWGATRAGQAESALRLAGRITFNKRGRAVLVAGQRATGP